jgi:hypothetical protein
VTDLIWFDLLFLTPLSAVFQLPVYHGDQVFSGVRVTRSLVVCVCFVDRCLSPFFWPFCCLFFFDLWILITPLVSSNFSIKCFLQSIYIFIVFHFIVLTQCHAIFAVSISLGEGGHFLLGFFWFFVVILFLCSLLLFLLLICFFFFFFSFFFFHHNIVYSKSPVYNNLNDPGVNIKGPCFTKISLVQG